MATALTILVGLIGLIWLTRHLELNRARSEPILRASDAPPHRDALPPLTVLVAGKDEEPNIAACLAGLQAQQYPNLQIVAVNDRSGDRTGAIIDQIAAGDPRVLARHVQELPPGWFGKNNAMRMGIEQARGAWLAFTDADCKFDSPHLLAAAMHFALREQVALLSVLPRLEAATFWERVVQPVAGGILVYWNPPRKVNSPDPNYAYANGAFMLMPRATYEAIGRHEAVKATLNEDMHMARLAKRAGLKLRVIRNDGLYRVRMYTGFRQIWRGWSRIFYGCFGTLVKLLRSMLLLSVMSILPWLVLIVALATGYGGAPLLIASLATVAAQQSVLWRFYHVSGIARPWALLYPLGAAVCLGMIVSALGKLRGSGTTNWRGTTYRGGAQTTAGSIVNP